MSSKYTHCLTASRPKTTPHAKKVDAVTPMVYGAGMKKQITRGAMIRSARKERGWSQTELSKRLQAIGATCGVMAVSNWERDERVPACPAALNALLDIPIRYLVKG
jgi:ribosome-binding protein aMBF1 (putative translation factor)